MIELTPEASREQVLNLLRTEAKLQQQHLELLTKQKKALVSCDRPLFNALHARYEQLLVRLEQQAQQRLKILPASAEQLKQAIDSWPAEARDEALMLTRLLGKISARAKSQAAQNQILIANDLKLVNFKLNLFMSAVNRGPYYVSTGKAVPVAISRLINRTI